MSSQVKSILSNQSLLLTSILIFSVVITIIAVHLLQPAWMIYRQAENALQSGNFQKAITLYEKARSEGLQTSKLYNRLAEANFLIRNFSDASKWLQEAIKLEPNKEAYLQLAQAFQALNQPKDAIQIIHRIPENLRTPTARLMEADLYRQIGDYAHAEEIYRSGFSDPILSQQAMIDLAEMLSWQGRNEEAVKIFHFVLSKNPKNSEARLGLARTLSWSGHWHEAETEYNKLLQTSSHP